MNSSSFPNDPLAVLVIDASVVINLNATGRAADIVRAIPGTLVVTENAFAELACGAGNGHGDGEKLRALIDCGAVQLVKLGEPGTNIYASLVEGSAIRTLDDGEAATIAYAYEVGGVAVIDERKARNICANGFTDIVLACTVDLLTHSAVRSALGKRGQVDAILGALRVARMNVPPARIELVIGLIGEAAAASCSSLPKRIRGAS